MFSEMLHSLYDFGAYPGYMRQSKGHTLRYGFLVGLIYFLGVFLLPVGAAVAGFGGLPSALNSILPEFRLEDGRLWVEEPIEYVALENGGLYVKIDTQQELVEQTTESDLLAFDQALVADAERILLKQDGQITELSFAELKLDEIDWAGLLSAMRPYLMLVGALLVLVMLAVLLLDFWVDVLVLALLGKLLQRFAGGKYRYAQLVSLSVHAMTVGALLEIIGAWLPVTIPYFWVICYGVPLFYIWKVLGKLRSGE